MLAAQPRRLRAGAGSGAGGRAVLLAAMDGDVVAQPEVSAFQLRRDCGAGARGSAATDRAIRDNRSMSYPTVVSVNTARARTMEQKPLLVSAIDKVPLHGPVTVLGSGLEGDEVGNTRHHGGTARAVYAFAAEDLEWWGRELGKPVRPGLFGENLTVGDLDLNSCVVGEQWLVGTARLQVTSVRTPCEPFARWMRMQGFDADRWEERFVGHGRPGVFLAVLGTGWIQAGDPVDVVDRPDHGLTAQAMFRALTTEPALLPMLLEVEGLPLAVYDRAQRYVDG
jgi:MOSC domain-containing protein YiiM